MSYGATGYTGRITSEHAKRATLDFVLAGRTESKLKELSVSLAVPYIVFGVDDSHTVDAALGGIAVLLNCAGPFMRTAAPLIGACIRNGIHYLDIAAELNSYRLAEERDGEAQRANVMLLPGCGSSLAMLDLCQRIGESFPTGDLDAVPEGPTEEQREASPYHAAVVVTAADGTVRRAVLHTVNGYTFTPIASVEAARRVLAGEARLGFQTPAVVFGSGFVGTIAGSQLKDMP